MQWIILVALSMHSYTMRSACLGDDSIVLGGKCKRQEKANEKPWMLCSSLWYGKLLTPVFLKNGDHTLYGIL